MPTHPHLVIEPKAPRDLPIIMQCLTQVYARYFNKKYKTFGHLWQGRFKNMLIQKDEYFIECIYYVEMNPVRAGLVNSPAQYRWSSYHERTLGEKTGLLDLPDST
jgi:putative transposase